MRNTGWKRKHALARGLDLSEIAEEAACTITVKWNGPVESADAGACIDVADRAYRGRLAACPYPGKRAYKRKHSLACAIDVSDAAEDAEMLVKVAWNGPVTSDQVGEVIDLVAGAYADKLLDALETVGQGRQTSFTADGRMPTAPAASMDVPAEVARRAAERLREVGAIVTVGAGARGGRN